MPAYTEGLQVPVMVPMAHTHLLPVIQAQPWLAQHIGQFGQGSL